MALNDDLFFTHVPLKYSPRLIRQWYVCVSWCVFVSANLDVRFVQEKAGNPRQDWSVVPRQHGQAGHTGHGHGQ